MRRLDVSPRPPSGNHPDLAFAKSKLFSHAFERFSRIESPPDLKNIFLGYFRAMVALASFVPAPILQHHVSDVVCPAACKQMERIAAWRVVALMTTILFRFEDHTKQFNGNARGNIAFRVLLNVSISVAGLSAHPRPASIGATRSINLIPEKINKISGILGAHCKLLTCDAVPSAVDAARGFRYAYFTIGNDGDWL